MFLYSIYINEGSPFPQNVYTKSNELCEGENPKAKLVPNQTVNQWATPKPDALVNQRWEKLRNLY